MIRTACIEKATEFLYRWCRNCCCNDLHRHIIDDINSDDHYSYRYQYYSCLLEMLLFLFSFVQLEGAYDSIILNNIFLYVIFGVRISTKVPEHLYK